MSSSDKLAFVDQKWFSTAKAAFWTFGFAFATYFTVGIYSVMDGNPLNYGKIIVLLFWLTFLTLFFLSIKTGKIDKFRWPLFTSMAVLFPIDFIATLYELRSHFMVVTMEDFVQSRVPFCHVVIPQILGGIALKKEIAFPGSLLGDSNFGYTIAFMIITWIGVSVFLGRGFCSWACFWGGWEEGMSRVLKKPKLKFNPKKLLILPFAIFFSTLLLSTVSLTPVYCMWVCSFKACSEFVEIISPQTLVQGIIFITLFLALVIILPLLTKKRTQCSFICPFGAMQSFVDKISPFRVKIKTDDCISCGKCKKACPIYAIEDKSYTTGKVRFTCMKCGKCCDVCPTKAIRIHIFGIPFSKLGSMLVRDLYTFCGFFILATMGGGIMLPSLLRIGSWIFGG